MSETDKKLLESDSKTFFFLCVQKLLDKFEERYFL